MNLPNLAVRRPVTTAMLLASLLVFGAIAANRLPLAFLPEVDAPFVGVVVPYPNSNPLQIEKEITKPIEEVLSTLAGIKRMRSTSDPDSARVFLLFDWGRDIDVVRMQVSELLEQIKPELPAEIGEVQIFSFNTNDIPVVEARLSAEGVDLSESWDLLEARVLNRLRRVPGVARVDLDGVAPRQIYIDLVLAKIKAHNVNVGDLIGKLRGTSANLVLGEVRDGGLRYTARSLGTFSSLDAIRDLVIDAKGLRLGDIAEINYEQPAINYGRLLDRKEAIALNVFKESTANTVEVVRGVMAVINGEIDQDPLLQGVSVFVWDDQAEQIVNSIDGLKSAGFQGSLLAIAILYFFLRRMRTTIMVSLAIPFSVIVTCGVLYFLGKSLNILSMMGLMLGVGMLVDNAIVVLEAIDRRSRDEPDRRMAALFGAKQVALAVTASTATTLIVFLPLIVGDNSELTVWLGEVGLAISLSLAVSLFASLTLIPLAAATWLPAGTPKRVPSIEWLEQHYQKVLAWTLDHRWKTVGLLTASMALAIVPLAAGWVETSQFSGTTRERLRLEYEFTDFAYKSRAREAVEKVEDVLYAQQKELGIESIYSWFSSGDGAASTLTLVDKNLPDDEFKALRKKIRETLPEIAGVELTFDDDEDTNSGTTAFSVNFYGQDTTVLAPLAQEALRRLETIEGLADIRTSLQQGRKEIQVRIDRQKAAVYGLTAREVADLFSFTLAGVRLPRFNAGTREVDTELALRIEDRTNLEDLRALEFRAADGRPLLLGDIADFEVIERPQAIERENRKVRAAISGSYEGESWDETKQQIENLMNAFSLPPGYSWSWNQRILEQDDQDTQMVLNLLLALALVFLVMAALFESLAQPFAILLSIPFALPGVTWLLALTGTPLNLMAMIGMLILIGIVVNNGIVLLDHLNQLRREGMGDREAILEAGRDRLRAILMTASTTVLGLVPLAIGGSTVGNIFYYPLALTVMGGLTSSVILTLVVLPNVNFTVERVAKWFSTVWRTSSPVAKSAPASVVVAET
ncbi:MAG: efflux RND transporter permease subunit [Thermoanaerobaculia bacterium]|nr:efflux RND transporter permease subunit [Thermoanaerobaculia bacterium]